MAQQIQFIYLTQSDFDNLSPKESKLYFTSDTKRIYRGSELYAATSFDQLNFSSIEASAITVNGSAVSLEGHTHSASDIDGLGAFVSAATQNFSQNGHTHVIADVTNLSGIVAGITNTTVSKSSGAFNTLTVGGSNVSVEGHTHSISEVTGLSSAIQDIVPIEFITSSAFDALSVKDSNTIYFVDDNSIYKGDELYGATSFDQLEFSDIAARSITVNGSSVALDGHTHAFNDITGLSDILSGITSSSIAKDSVSAQTGTFTSSLTVGNSNVSLEGHTHSIDDIEDFDEQGIFEVTGTIDLSNFPSVSVSVNESLADACQAIQDGRPVRLTLQWRGNGYISSFTGIHYTSNGSISELNFIMQLDAAIFNPDQQMHPYMFSLSWYYDNNENENELWTLRPYELATTDHTHDISDIEDLETTLSGFASSSHTHVMSEVTGLQSAIDGLSSIYAGTSHSHAISDITNLSSILTGVSESSLTKNTITGDIGNFRLLSVSGSANFAVNNVSANAISVNGTPVSLEGHTHGVSEVTGLSNVLSGISETGITKDTVTASVGVFANSLTVGGSSVAVYGHTHSIADVTGLSATIGRIGVSVSNLNSSVQSLQSQITPVQCITLAQYEALQTVDASTIYFISDGNRIYRGSVLYAATTFDQLNFSSIEASDITVNGSAVALEGHTHDVSDITGLSSYATQSWVTQQINSAISAVLASQY